MKKVCIVTAARSEYGLLRWIIDGIYRHPKLELQLIVTGAHLLEEQGNTYQQIEENGYPISAKVDMHLNTVNKETIAKSMGYCAIGMAETFARLQPDLLVILGDRYELLPICNVALVMNIPIAHISGGDVTLGAIDNEVRNAITMMSTLHFPSVQDSADNIVRMRGSDKYVWPVGEPGLDNFRHTALMSRNELSDYFGIPTSDKWILVTVHPETKASLEYNMQMAHNIFHLTESIDHASVVITKANADFGGAQINAYWDQVTAANPKKYHFYSSLGQIRYPSFMNECYAVLGNSSSGIVEAPCLGVWVINIGNRQSGRHLCKNVYQTENDIDVIHEAWCRIESHKEKIVDNFYGDGFTSEKIIKHIEEYLYAR